MISTPLPHVEGQVVAFPGPVETTYGPLTVTFQVSLIRHGKRRRCSVCGLRRICFSVGLGDLLQSPPLCARDAGIR